MLTFRKSRAQKARAREEERLFLLALLDRALECCPVLASDGSESASCPDVSSSDSMHSPKPVHYASSDSPQKALGTDMKSMIMRSRCVRMACFFFFF